MNPSTNPVTIPRSGRVQMTINVSVDVNITATTARRQVNALTNPVDGRVGRVGEVDVDVKNGELLLTENQISLIKQNALHLTASSSS